MRTILFTILLISLFSCKGDYDYEQHKIDLEASKNIQEGMNLKEAMMLIREPDNIRKTKNTHLYDFSSKRDSVFIFYYNRPPMASSSINFYTDSSYVLQVYNKME